MKKLRVQKLAKRLSTSTLKHLVKFKISTPRHAVLRISRNSSLRPRILLTTHTRLLSRTRTSWVRPQLILSCQRIPNLRRLHTRNCQGGMKRRGSLLSLRREDSNDSINLYKCLATDIKYGNCCKLDNFTKLNEGF